MRMKPLIWSGDLAYAIGLFVADGHLSIDKRHLDFTSKDVEQVETFRKSLGLTIRITRKAREKEKIKKYFHVSFGDVELYRFLKGIGIPQQKSKEIKKVVIPVKFFPDFLRGYLDGDGSVHIYKHPETTRKQLKIRFFSGSLQFLFWLRSNIKRKVSIHGRINRVIRAWSLIYSKREALKLTKFMFYSKNLPQLKRKSGPLLEYLEKNKDFISRRWQNRFTILSKK